MIHIHLKGINNLTHISQWNNNGLWMEWNLGELHDHIRNPGKDLKSKLVRSFTINQHM